MVNRPSDAKSWSASFLRPAEPDGRGGIGVLSLYYWCLRGPSFQMSRTQAGMNPQPPLTKKEHDSTRPEAQRPCPIKLAGAPGGDRKEGVGKGPRNKTPVGDWCVFLVSGYLGAKVRFCNGLVA